MSLKIIHGKNLRWIDIVSPQQDELNFLKKNFEFHELDYNDMVGVSQHTKIEARDAYNLIVLLFPVYHKKTGEITPGEVDFFVGEDYLISVHNGDMYTMTKLIEETHKHDETRRLYLGKNAGFLLYNILESLFKRSFPILDHITRDMAEIEQNIFSDQSVEMLERISLMKRNIIDFRRIMKTHHLMIKRLINKKDVYLAFPDSKRHYTNLLEHAENIWDILAIQKETIEALQDANQSLATNRLNQITKVMTIFSATFLPATLVLFAFGLSFRDLPFSADPHAFWKVLGLAAIGSTCALLYFKYKKWL